MNELVSVVIFISNADSIKRYRLSEDGSLFSRHLMKGGIGYAVYVPPHINIGTGDLSWGGNVQPVTLDYLKTCVDQLLHRSEVVFFVSDSIEAITSLAGKEGCLSFLLTGEGTPGFENKKYIEIKTLLSLNVYFEESLPVHLLTILRRRPDAFKDAINIRNKRIAEQIGAVGGAYIFGAHTVSKQVYAECLKAGIKIFGFVDNDVNKQGHELFGLPVVSPSALNPESDVVVLASGNYSYDIFQQLQRLGFEYIQNLSEFFFSVNCRSQPEIYYHDDLWNNNICYHVLYLRLADAASRNVLENIVQYRQTFELLPLSRICDRLNPQWFDKQLFIPDAGHVFVDGGAFDGDTALRFLHINGNHYKAIHLFEVDPCIAQKAADNLKGHERVYVHNLGLSNKRGSSFFSQTGLTDGHLEATDGIQVKLDSIDNVVEGQITFLKLDVEGAEENAIAGAMRHITDNSPMLAIAVYHKAGDIWAVPSQILSINQDYSFYLRHYTQVSYETVIYGMPDHLRLNSSGMYIK